MPNFFEEKVEKGQNDKIAQYPLVWNGNSQICPRHTRMPGLHFSDHQFASLTTKIREKIEKTVFIDQFQTVSGLPTIMGQVCSFITPPYQFWCYVNFVLISYTNQKLWRKAVFFLGGGGVAQPLLGIERVYAY